MLQLRAGLLAALEASLKQELSLETLAASHREGTATGSQRHLLLSQCTSTERFLVCHRVLEGLRERLAIDCKALG